MIFLQFLKFVKFEFSNYDKNTDVARDAMSVNLTRDDVGSVYVTWPRGNALQGYTYINQQST